jgi:PAS domain S-box-containing protein
VVEEVRDYGIFALDPDGRVASWNRGAERIKGWRAEEIMSQHFSRFYPPETRASLPADMLARARGQGSAEDEGWRLRKDGSRFWANVVVTALRDEGGQLKGFAKISRATSRPSGRS